MRELDRLLEYYEDVINENRCKCVEELHVRTLCYKTVERVPITVLYPYDGDEFKNCSYSEAFRDYDKMLYRELLCDKFSIYNSLMLDDDYPYQIRPNYGTGIIASLFGVECVLTSNNMPWVRHVDSRDEIRAIVNNGIPGFNNGLGKTVTECMEFFREKLEKFPKCARTIKIQQPDLQGPFDTAHLMWGNDMFYCLLDEPALAHNLLALITDTYIAFRKYLEQFVNDKCNASGFFYITGGIYKGSILIKDDTAINLSPEMYLEFVRPYNERLLAEFPGGIHHCGNGRQWRQLLLDTKSLQCLDFGNPEMQELSELYPKVRERGVPIVNFGRGQGQKLLEKYDFKKTYNTGLTLCIKADNRDEASRILHGLKQQRKRAAVCDRTII